MLNVFKYEHASPVALIGRTCIALTTLALLFIRLCDVAVAQQGTIPDTLDWRRYFPLEIGNQWQYESVGGGEQFYYRYTVTGDTLIDGVQYKVYDGVAFDESKQRFGERRDYLRYSQSGAHMVHVFRQADNSFSDQRWWTSIPCGLDGPFGQGEVYACAGEAQDFDVMVFGRYGGEITLQQDTVRVAAIKEIDSIFGGYAFAADVGLIGHAGEASGQGSSLVYARVRDVLIGYPIVPTSADVPEPTPVQLSITKFYPNPVVGRAYIEYHVDKQQDLTLEVFNMLGQQVYSVSLGKKAPGIYRHELFGSHSARPAPGVYALRLFSRNNNDVVRRFVLLN